MGYWNTNPDGASLLSEDTGMVWGDAPADILGEAIDQIIAVFIEDIGRKPTEAELVAGMKFSAGTSIRYYGEQG